jgi:sialate O-acetylesterase
VREVQGAMRTHPNTGVAVTIDIGDPSDIHPHNKKDVAFRLAKQAERICYGYPGVVEGPLYDSMRIEGDRIRISFTNLGGGLVARGGAIGEHSFAIAGADGRHVWADAQVEGDTVVVWSAAVPEPVSVRYAWGMCPPNPNLYNAEGFPAYPFRTDAHPA